MLEEEVMNCSDWQMRIAAEDPAAAEHVSGCQACREFARELSRNAAALRTIVVDAAAYTAMRARVMDAVQAKRRYGWLWGAGVAGATVTACIALIWFTAALRVPEAPHPQAVTYRIAPPESQVAVVPRMVNRRPARRAEPKRPLTAIKLLTDDPNVVIIWLVDNRKGDSL
jgi:hypothetical protein